MLQSTRADLPFYEGIEVEFADSNLTGSGYSIILSGSGRLRDKGDRSEAR